MNSSLGMTLLYFRQRNSLFLSVTLSVYYLLLELKVFILLEWSLMIEHGSRIVVEPRN
jgi:hypothetical protein